MSDVGQGDAVEHQRAFCRLGHAQLGTKRRAGNESRSQGDNSRPMGSRHQRKFDADK